MGILDTFRLDGRSALITGGTKGLGRAMASALADVGANVAVCSRNGDQAATVAAEIAAQYGVKTAGYEADVTNPGSVVALAAKCTDALGSIDILVNSAGINVRKLAPQLTEEDWDSVIDISVKGSFLCSQAVMPAMMERGWGRIIMMGSIMSFISLPGRAAYATAKTALLGLTRTLALEGAARGVTVNCICPGPFDTPMNRPLLDDPVAFQAFLAKIPVGRWGDPIEMGGAVVYLCSPAAAFVTGSSFVIDGGWTLQ